MAHSFTMTRSVTFAETDMAGILHFQGNLSGAEAELFAHAAHRWGLPGSLAMRGAPP